MASEGSVLRCTEGRVAPEGRSGRLTTSRSERRASTRLSRAEDGRGGRALRKAAADEDTAAAGIAIGGRRSGSEGRLSAHRRVAERVGTTER